MSIRFNKISDFAVDVNSDPFSAGAAGIDISGTGGIGSEISNVIIENNYITNMTNGYSENISVGGNIKTWDILNNYIHTVTNIGIDAIGGENNSSTHSVNAARNGLILGNTVINLVEPSANTEGVAAIYVDGGRNIHIAYNDVDITSHGYTIGTENCLDTSNITLINNSSLNAVFEDLTVGGYSSQGYIHGVDSECDGGGGGHGSVSKITVDNNIFNSPEAIELSTRYDSTPVLTRDTSPVQVNYRISSAIINQAGDIESNENGDGVTPFGENHIKKTTNSSNSISVSSITAASNTGNTNKIIDDDETTQWNNTVPGIGTSFDLYLDGTYTISSLDFLSQWDSKIIVEVNGQQAFSGWTENTGTVNYTINFTTPLTGNVITIKSQTGQNWLAVREVSNIVGVPVNVPSISSVSAASNTTNEDKIIDGDNSNQWNNTSAGVGTSFDLYLDGTYTISSLDFLSQWDSKIIVEVNGQEAFSGWTANEGGVNYTINFTTPLTGNVITIKSYPGQNWLTVKEVKL